MQENKDFWFPAKEYRFGCGLPVTWQGWMVLLGYLAVVLVTALMLSESRDLLRFMPLHLVLMGLFIFIFLKNG